MDLTHHEIPTDDTVATGHLRGRASRRGETRTLSGSSRAPSGPHRRGLRALGTIVAVLGLVGLAAGCRVPAPTVRQGLDYGFRTPKQAFGSWRTAVQGNLLVEEYRCFSRHWRATNRVTLLDYGEARDQILEEYPQLRWAVYSARDPEELVRNERAAILVSKIPGPLWFEDRFLLVKLRRQAFWELSVEDSPLRPEFGGQIDQDPFRAGLYYFDESSDRFFVIIDEFSENTDLPDAEVIHLAAAGWEWKIDSFTILAKDELPEEVGTLD
jgi:hypothetical protein